MVDIDSFLEGELASINEVLEQFQTDDKKAKQRNLEEEKLLESKNATVSEKKLSFNTGTVKTIAIVGLYKCSYAYLVAVDSFRICFTYCVINLS